MTSSRPLVKRRLPIPMMSPAEDRLLAIVTAMAAEISVLRERLDTMQHVLERQGTIGSDQIECFAATPEDVTRRDAERMGLIARVFRPLREAAERDAGTLGARGLEEKHV